MTITATELWHQTPIGVQVARGFVWAIQPGSHAAIVATEDEESGEIVHYGYSGGDVPPCSGTYLADEGHAGYFVLTESADTPEVPEGWTVVPVNLDNNWSYEDGSWRVRKVGVAGWTGTHEDALFAGRA